jgi:hypothetical protein
METATLRASERLACPLDELQRFAKRFGKELEPFLSSQPECGIIQPGILPPQKMALARLSP